MLDLFRAKLLGIEPEKFKEFQTLIRGYQLPEGGHHSTIVGSPTSWSWGRATKAEIEGTAGKLWKFAGVGADPTEISGLADLAERAHSSLTGIGASDHHVKTTSFADITDRAGATKLNWGANKLLKGAGAGADPTEIDVAGILGIKAVRKAADETVNNSATLQNDDELLFAIAPNEVWHFYLFLRTYSSAVADIMFRWTLPTGASISWRSIGLNEADTLEEWTGILTSSVLRRAGKATYYPVVCHGVIVNGANAGDAQLQWAQNTAEASDTIVGINSCIIAHRLA